MYTRLFEYQKARKQSFFLFGPRGVGKTSWLDSTIGPINRIDLLNARIFLKLSSDPTRLESYVTSTKDWIVIDEVQKAPSLLDEVHRLIEKKKYRFILTGSSARKLKKVGTNLLAGRAITERVYPLTVRELAGDFSLSKSLHIGHLPMAYVSEEPERFLESYVQTYLKEEIQQEGIIRNLGGFVRFLEAASFSQGQYLNISKVAADCGVDRKVVESYFHVLEDLLLAERLPHFRKKLARKSDFHPKFFYFDVGVFRTLRPQGPEDEPGLAEGAALESLVYQELRAMNSYLNGRFQFYCWKRDNKTDVDLVLYGANGLFAFEIKRASRLRGGELNGLTAFKEKYPSAKCYYLYGGDEERLIDNIKLVPVEKFLRSTAQDIFEARTKNE